MSQICTLFKNEFDKAAKELDVAPVIVNTIYDDNNEKIAARQFISKLVIMLKDYDVNKHRDVIEIDYYSNQIIKSKKEGK